MGWARRKCAKAEERPQIVPRRSRPQENKKPKNGKEPRAVGIVQFSGGSKGTLIPVAILIDGKFYDASAYKADPVPMALEPGTVYEAETTGDPDGLFVVNGALHSQSRGERASVGRYGNLLAAREPLHRRTVEKRKTCR